ncbi:TRAP transporter small permease subunit [Luteolibacter sp. AS25]|uniref:TRAP transporter small permease subunit n=1 Tax=Luteolibacter sp. AS25 TaxID=3135776 RepID=UPI00398A8A04
MKRILFATLRGYVLWVTRINKVIGHIAMYSLFVMMAILSYGVFTNVIIKSPAIWVMEMAQFSMAAYYLLGGGFTLQQGAHVRMDVVYDRFSPRVKSIIDSVTGIFLLFYLVILVYGGISSTQYALEYSQKNYSAWGPPMAPIKIIMTTGMTLMLLQAIAIWIEDVVKAFGKELT